LSADKPSLYERLGGVYSIATVVDDFIDRVMTDPKLNANPQVNEAHHRVPPAGFKYPVTEMVCWASGGPQKYTGRAMAESHADLKITGKEWDAFLDDFQQTLDKFAVPAEEQAELKAIVNSTPSIPSSRQARTHNSTPKCRPKRPNFPSLPVGKLEAPLVSRITPRKSASVCNALAPGTRLGQVIGPLGASGMGE